MLDDGVNCEQFKSNLECVVPHNFSTIARKLRYKGGAYDICVCKVMEWLTGWGWMQKITHYYDYTRYKLKVLNIIKNTIFYCTQRKVTYIWKLYIEMKYIVFTVYQYQLDSNTGTWYYLQRFIINEHTRNASLNDHTRIIQNI